MGGGSPGGDGPKFVLVPWCPLPAAHPSCAAARLPRPRTPQRPRPRLWYVAPRPMLWHIRPHAAPRARSAVPTPRPRPPDQNPATLPPGPGSPRPSPSPKAQLVELRPTCNNPTKKGVAPRPRAHPGVGATTTSPTPPREDPPQGQPPARTRPKSFSAHTHTTHLHNSRKEHSGRAAPRGRPARGLIWPRPSGNHPQHAPSSRGACDAEPDSDPGSSCHGGRRGPHSRDPHESPARRGRGVENLFSRPPSPKPRRVLGLPPPRGLALLSGAEWMEPPRAFAGHQLGERVRHTLSTPGEKRRSTCL